MFCLLLIWKRLKKKRKEKGERARGLPPTPPGQTHIIGCATLGLSQLLGVIKSYFKG
jgi:hypothetical protein